MSILDRYLIRAVLGGTLMVLMVLLALSGFISFIGQLDNVGTGTYSLPDALVYVLLQLPLMAFDMLPIAALIGSLLGLGALASRSELIVARAAGVSIWRMARAVAVAGVLLLVAAAALGEYVAPPAENFSIRFRAAALNDDLALQDGPGGWIRNGNIILNIGQLEGKDMAGGIYIFTLGDDQDLKSVAMAQSASVDKSRRWALDNYRETRFGADGIEVFSARDYVRETGVSPAVLALSVVEPERLPARGLLRYARYLERNNLDADRYAVAFWARIAMTVSVMVMTVLGLPFVFGSLRSVGAGQRMLVGVLLGTLYFFGSRTLASSGTVYGLNPLLSGILPVLILSVITVTGLARSR